MKTTTIDGVVVMPRVPIVGSLWRLREILPDRGEPYYATFKHIRRDRDNRLWATFEGEDGRCWETEIWLAPSGSCAKGEE